MTAPHEQPQRQIESKTRWGEQSISWGLIAVLVIVLLVQATKKISGHRTKPDSMPIVYVTPPPGEEQPSLSETMETTGQR
jgi:hypothetical protein